MAIRTQGPSGEVVTDGIDARLCTAMGLLNVATAEVVAAIDAALEDGGWEGHGIATPEHWVALRCGVSPARARRLVSLARALRERPVASRSFAEGVLGEEKVDLLCRFVDPPHDAELTDLARHMTLSQLRRVVPFVDPPDPEPAPAEPQPGVGSAEEGVGDEPGRREAAFGHGEDGRWWARFMLPADEGALVEKALGVSREHLIAAGDGPPHRVGWSDALVQLAEAALTNIEATGRLPGDRYQVIFHVDAGDPARARLHLGALLPKTLADYLACDATGRVVLHKGGTPMHVFARRRTVDERLRVLIERRDRRCRVPGCGRTRGLHVHHLRHAEDGGETVPENLCCLCPAHHRLHHAGRLRIEGDPTSPDGLRFLDPRGRPIRGPDPTPPGGPPADAARALGLPASRYRPPTGERMDSWWISWS
ncbi:MAG: DUF222 domain-containing protein [Acidimicrobiia bacterium]